jgi:hypothetical protein
MRHTRFLARRLYPTSHSGGLRCSVTHYYSVSACHRKRLTATRSGLTRLEDDRCIHIEEIYHKWSAAYRGRPQYSACHRKVGIAPSIHEAVVEVGCLSAYRPRISPGDVFCRSETGLTRIPIGSARTRVRNENERTLERRFVPCQGQQGNPFTERLQRPSPISRS